MLNRAFFSLQSNWIPTLVALGNLFVNVVLDLLFVPLGVWGIPLATSLVNIAGTAPARRAAPPPRRADPLRRDRGLVDPHRVRRAALLRDRVRRLVGLDDALGRGLVGQLVGELDTIRSLSSRSDAPDRGSRRVTRCRGSERGPTVLLGRGRRRGLPTLGGRPRVRCLRNDGSDETRTAL